MEKIVIKPLAQEINIKGNLKEGFGDAYAYEGSSEEERHALGNLYVIGNVKEDAEAESSMDMAYVVNLVASLAKREYYANSSLPPRQAFSAALRKVNDVIVEFFKNKNLKLDVGVFAIAGENIFISKVGKFKVVLAREDRTIDILNNIDLFTKDQEGEKEFSNVVSGSVKEGDRILAFFPSRQMVAREKTLKTSLASLQSDEFVAKVTSIQEQKPDFSCCALYISIEKTKEPALAPKKKMVQKSEPAVILASNPEPEAKIENQIEEEPIKEEPIEVPKIIPSEFALGKKRSMLPASIINMPLAIFNNKKTRTLAFGIGAIVLVIVALSAKSIFFKSPEEKAIETALAEADNSIKEAQNSIDNNDLTTARRILNSALASIGRVDSDKVKDKSSEVNNLIDSIDQAIPAKLTLAGEIHSDLGSALLIQPRGNDLIALTDKDTSSSLVSISNGSTNILGEASDINPHISLGNAEKTVFMNTGSGQIVLLTKDGKIQSGTTTPVITDASFYEGNIYIIENGNIKKISDVTEGANPATNWLEAGQSVAGNKLGVDGNVYTISESGVLTTYFKGKKTKEVQTGIPVNNDYKLIASTDLDSIYIIHRTLGRFYVLDKETGAITRTIKTEAGEILVDAAVTNDGTMYILSKDNKIWKLE